jgi:hypothetical protein
MVAEPVATVAAVMAPEPSATSPALFATALGPMATELTPVAVESGRVELAWKYSIPAPLASAFSVAMLLFAVDRPVERDPTPL